MEAFVTVCEGQKLPKKTGSWGWGLRPVVSTLGKTKLQGFQVQGQLRQCSKSSHVQHAVNNTSLTVFKNLLKDGIFFNWETIQTGGLPANLTSRFHPRTHGGRGNQLLHAVLWPPRVHTGRHVWNINVTFSGFLLWDSLTNSPSWPEFSV